MTNVFYDADYIYNNTERAITTEIKHGLKVRVNRKTLDDILTDKGITDTFNLNIKRLNRWWYSVYFNEKE